jgi:putative thioredoxin
MLMPVLAQLVEQYQGKFFLAKVDTDAEQALAARYGIRSLPTVKLFKDGEVVDEFLGVQPERSIRALLDRHIPRASDAAVDQALAELRAGDPLAAARRLEGVLATEPNNDRAKLELAGAYAAERHFDRAAALLDALSGDAKVDAKTVALRARLEFAQIAALAASTSELERAIAANPADSEARYQLSASCVLAGDHERALEQLLEIVRHDRKFRDPARKAMLAVFNLLGNRGELVKKYRALLSSALN